MSATRKPRSRHKLRYRLFYKRQMGLTLSIELTIALRDPLIGLAASERAEQWQISHWLPAPQAASAA